ARIAVDGEVPWSPPTSFAPIPTQLVPNPLGLGYSMLPYVASGKLFDSAQLLSPWTGFLAAQAAFTKGAAAMTTGALEAFSQSSRNQS
ncbi:MAG: hypothetical protein AAFQ82_27090, partial [Myxococcota bacterium]